MVPGRTEYWLGTGGDLDAKPQLRHFGLQEVRGEVPVPLQGYPNVSVAQDPAHGG
jgi:hypothetical protein